MRVADWIIADLWGRGVRHIFGVVGGNSLYLTDAIYQHVQMQFVPMHGEKDAGYAAIGYAKEYGGLGVACVTTGCASTNIVTAVLSAWQDSVPLVILAGQVPTEYLCGGGRQSGTQGANIEPIVRTITKGVYQWESQNGFTAMMDLAITQRRGPVWISVPLNWQRCSLAQGSDTPVL